jgi:hypothetical protein
MGDERSIRYLYYLNSSITSKKPCMRKHPCKAFLILALLKLDVDVTIKLPQRIRIFSRMLTHSQNFTCMFK